MQARWIFYEEGSGGLSIYWSTDWCVFSLGTLSECFIGFIVMFGDGETRRDWQKILGSDAEAIRTYLDELAQHVKPVLKCYVAESSLVNLVLHLAQESPSVLSKSEFGRKGQDAWGRG